MKNFNFFRAKLLKSVAAAALAVGVSSFMNAQVNTYQFTQSSGTYTPIVGGTVLGAAVDNSSTGNLNSNVYATTIPFNFQFKGVVATNINVSSNGFITFGSLAPTTTLTAPMSSTNAYDGVIAPFARDLSSFYDLASLSGSIKTDVVGTAPNREFVIEWSNFRPANSTSTTAAYSFSFQVRLNELDNSIKFVYGPGSHIVGTQTSSSTVQVGLRGATTADFNNRTNTTSVAFVNSSAGTAVGNTQAYSTTATSTQGMPTDGLTYTWMPPTCFPPTNILASNVTTTTADLSWTASLSSPNMYDVYYSTSSTAPTSATVPMLSDVVGTSTPVSGLQNSSMYNVWVRSVCSSTDRGPWSMVGNFVTACDALTGGYFEGFEGYAGVINGNAGILPNCWTQLGSTNGGHISSSTTITGANTLYMWTSGTRIAYVALPPMTTLQSGLYKLSFDAKASVTANGILQVGYIDASDNFVQLTTFSVTSTNTVYPFTYDIPVLPAGVTKLALKNLGTPANSLSLDNISYELKTLSTSETMAKTAVKVYPNPFVDVVNISNVEDVKVVLVTDASGRLVKTIDKVSKEVNLSTLKSGMYMLNINFKDGSNQSVKVIKK